MPENKKPESNVPERRKHPRIKGTVVEYAKSEAGPYHEPAFLKDLSFGGICLYVREAIKEGTYLYLRIHLLGNTAPICVKGKIVWHGRSRYLDYHDLGIQFSGMSKYDEQVLSQYVASHLET